MRGPARRAAARRGWLAARPAVAVSDLAKQLRAEDDDSPPLARVFKLSHASLPTGAARMLRLLALAPAGLVDPHIASGLAGCSVGSARTTLDDLVALGFLHEVESPLPQYEVPGCLQPLLWSLAESQERPGELQLARARMLERSVRLLQSCRAITETDSPTAREKLLAMPKALRFPTPGPPRSGCACVGPRCWPRSGTRSPTGSWTPSPDG